jgi:carboxypeptidase C (cathepsin A)
VPEEKEQDDKSSAPEKKTEIVEEKESVTEHTAKIGRKQVRYRAVARTTTLRDDKGKEKASVFSIAYTRLPEGPAADRPILFSFNGGPGSSSVWLHLGLFGPRFIDLGQGDTPQRPPYRLTDNDISLLDLCDLVFIDPVSTGYSRPAPGEEPKQFHGVQEDAEWVAEYIRHHLGRTKRWTSPKFLAGESYGTTRAAALSDLLQDRHGITLNGVMLISTVLNFQTILYGRGNDVLPYISYLPTYATTARYHGRLGRGLGDVHKVAATAEDFALDEYGPALLRGRRLDAKRTKAIIARLAELTGLKQEVIEANNLRVQPHRFMKELLRDQGRTVGRLDSRYTGIDFDRGGESPEYDPLFPFIVGGYTAAFNQYVREELEFESELNYEILKSGLDWNYGNHGKNRFVDVSENLRAAMSKNRGLKVLVASGLYDLGTPHFGAEYTVDHMPLDPSIAANVTTTRYEAGHMMYVHDASLKQLRKDLQTFVGNALA